MIPQGEKDPYEYLIKQDWDTTLYGCFHNMDRANTKFIEMAIKNGAIKCLIKLMSGWFDPPVTGMDLLAIESKQLPILRFLYDNNFMTSTQYQLASRARVYYSQPIIDYLSKKIPAHIMEPPKHTYSAPWMHRYDAKAPSAAQKLLEKAIVDKSWKLVQTMAHIATEHSMVLAIQTGDLRIIKILMETNCPVPEDALELAAKAGHMRVIKYLTDMGFEVTSDTIKLAAKNPAMLAYFTSAASLA